MEFLFELWIHRGLFGPYYAYVVEFSSRQRSAAPSGQFCASNFE